VGALGGESKPDPFAAEPAVTPEGVATALTLGAAPTAGAVAYDRVFWYDCALPADGKQYIVTLQPAVAANDCDLYVFQPAAGNMARVGLSQRGHAGNTLATPDWLAFVPPHAGRYSLGVYGYTQTTATVLDSYKIEVDQAVPLSAGAAALGGSMGATDSKWYWFDAVMGDSYTVTLTPTSGDPDLFVYGANSAKLRGKSLKTTGTDSVTFTADATGHHYVRVYGVSAAAYTITLTHTPAPGGPPVIAGCQIFPADNPWNTDISGYPLHPNSAAYINSIGATGHLHPDFGTFWEGAPIGFPFMVVAGTQAKVPMTFDYADESDPGPYPFPPNAPIEGGAGSDGDRHVLVLDKDHKVLYETWDSHPQADGSWHCGSGAKFDLTSNALRPDYWTSADAAGLPILPGLVRYDEVMAGEIRHAVRFTAPHTQRGFIHPATHYASSSTDPTLPPMGLRLRLKAGFDLSTYPAHVQTILRALKKYGMILADNGSSWFISGEHNPGWNDDELGTIKTVPGSAFEAVNTGPIIK
jgi:hypothetical protein